MECWVTWMTLKRYGGEHQPIKEKLHNADIYIKQYSCEIFKASLNLWPKKEEGCSACATANS